MAMMRRFLSIGLLLLLFVCAVVALRYDLSRWQLTRGDRAFHDGDLRAAFAIWSSASRSSSSRQLALINRGVARYRLGETAAARDDFREAAASDAPDIRRQALYNLGTTLLVIERQQKSTDLQQTKRLLAEALRHLQAAVELNPADTNAVHNKVVAQARLAAVTGREPPTSSPRQSPDKARRGSDASKQAGQPGTNAGKPGAATERDSAGQRRTAPSLSHEQALRVLDEARGRETLRSAVSAGNRQEKLTPPEKNW
jgi:tetratricopeptide (TPR) repeat protein